MPDGNRKSTWPIKTSALKSLGMAVDVSGWGKPKYPMGNPTCLLQKEGYSYIEHNYETG